MSNHTRGPWVVKRQGVVADKECGDVIATLGFRVAVGSTEDDDNARLIAAAPDLLSACELARAFLSDEPCDRQAKRDALTKVCAAIARAEGRT